MEIYLQAYPLCVCGVVIRKQAKLRVVMNKALLIVDAVSLSFLGLTPPPPPLMGNQFHQDADHLLAIAGRGKWNFNQLWFLLADNMNFSVSC